MLKTLRHFSYWGDKGNKVLCQAKWLQNKQMVGPFLQKKGDVAFHRTWTHLWSSFKPDALCSPWGKRGQQSTWRTDAAELTVEGPLFSQEMVTNIIHYIILFTLYPVCLSACSCCGSHPLTWGFEDSSRWGLRNTSVLLFLALFSSGVGVGGGGDCVVLPHSSPSFVLLIQFPFFPADHSETISSLFALCQY